MVLSGVHTSACDMHLSKFAVKDMPVEHAGCSTNFNNLVLSPLPACFTTGGSHSVSTATEMDTFNHLKASSQADLYVSVPISPTHFSSIGSIQYLQAHAF